MACVTMKTMLAEAKKHHYAVAAYNIIDYLTLKALVETAEKLQAPVVAQVSVKTIKFWGYDAIATWYRQLAENASIPVVLHLDHCKDLEVIQKCIDAGWTSVMIDASSYPFEKNVEMSFKARELADRAGVTLEAELGQIGGVEDDMSVADEDAHLADVEKSIAFCKQVRPDLFAPAIGTAHGVYRGEPKIAYDRIEQIANETQIAIALHGGTGLADDVFKKCISLGCAKINISTMLKHDYIDGFIDYRKQQPTDYEPIKFIQHQMDHMILNIEKIIKLFGSAGKA